MKKKVTDLLAKIGFTRESLVRFLIVALGSQFIYSINALRSVLFDPFRDTLGISNAQMGILLSTVAFVGMLAYIPGSWFTDRFSSRKIMSVSLFIVGTTSIYMTTAPSFPILVGIFVLWGFAQEGPFWASVLKSVRCTVPDNKQGSAFGFLELVRGSVEFFTNGMAIVIFTVVGSSIFGMKVAMAINGSLILLCGLLCWFFLTEDDFLKGDNAQEKNTEALKGVAQAIRTPETWLTGLTVMGIYTIYIGVQWFVPFLTNVYAMPIAAAAVFGLFNTSLTRMIASPTGGYVADNYFGSSINLMRLLLGIVAVFLTAILLLPKSASLVYVAMVVMICITVITYMLRGVYFAPIGEMKTPKAISGAAMSVAAMVGYSPAFWMNTVNGYLLDNYDPVDAYLRIFSLMIAGAVVGFASTLLMRRRADKAQEAELALQH